MFCFVMLNLDSYCATSQWLGHLMYSTVKPSLLRVYFFVSVCCQVFFCFFFKISCFFFFLGKKTFLGQNKSFWGPLELVEKLTPEAGEITASVKDLPGLK